MAYTRRTLLIGALLVAVTLAVFWPVVHHDFVNYDDPVYVTHNPIVQAGWTWAGVKWAFVELHGEATYWHPITWLSHMLDCQLFGLRPAGHHLTNLLFHAANTVLLFLVLWRMTSTGPRAVPGSQPSSQPSTLNSQPFTTAWPCFFVAALFALHPLQVDSVAWVAERKNLLSTFFGLLALLSYLKYVAGGRQPLARGASRNTLRAPFFYLLSLLLFALGLMSKPMLVPLPLVMLLLDYWPLRRLRLKAQDSRLKTQDSRLKTLPFLLAEKLPFLALSAASSLVTIRAHESLGALVSAQELPVPYRLANALVAYATYLRKVVWPVDLSVFYLHPGRWPASTVIGSGMLLLAITVLALCQARRRPYLIVGWLWFLVMLVPTIGLVQAHVQALADRFVYMPIIGLFIMGVWALAEWPKGWPARRGVQAGLAAAAIAACAVMSTLQLRYWRNSITLMQRAVRVEGSSFMARVMLGNSFFERGQLDAAVSEYQASVRLRPDYREAHYYLGAALLSQHKTGEAIHEYREALRLSPDYPDALNNLAWILAANPDPRLRNGPEAVELAERACKLTDYKQPLLVGTLAAAYAEAGRFFEAVATAEKARTLAEQTNQPDVAARNRALLELYRSGQPARDTP